jgi:hypothetical protein
MKAGTRRLPSAIVTSTSVAEESAAEAEGSFAMAQVLCHEACVQRKVFERHSGTNVIPKFLETFKDFPPRQKAASFAIDQAMEKLEAGFTGGSAKMRKAA